MNREELVAEIAKQTKLNSIQPKSKQIPYF